MVEMLYGPENISQYFHVKYFKIYDFQNPTMDIELVSLFFFPGKCGFITSESWKGERTSKDISESVTNGEYCSSKNELEFIFNGKLNQLRLESSFVIIFLKGTNILHV